MPLFCCRDIISCPSLNTCDQVTTDAIHLPKCKPTSNQSIMFHPTFFPSSWLIKTSLTNKHISIRRFILNNDNVSTFGHVLVLKLDCNLPPGVSTVFSKLSVPCIFYKQSILLNFFGHETVKTFLVIFYKDFSEC